MDAAHMGTKHLDEDTANTNETTSSRRPPPATKRRKLTGRDFLPSRYSLNREERALVDALRNLRAVEAQGLLPTPAALLEHGMISKRRAAELLDVSVVELEAMQHGTGRVGHALPIVDGEVPISELRRQWERGERRRLLELGQGVVGLVTVKGVQGWRGIKSAFALDGIESADGFGPVYDAEYLARRLCVSKAEAARLMEGPLFNWKLCRRAAFVTLEEIEAYQRKLELGRKAA